MKHPQTVAVDLDGVLATYDYWRGKEHIGEPLPGAHLFLTQLKLMGFKITVYTSRMEPHAMDYVRVWLTQNEMPYDELWESSGKPLAIAYVDDRGVECRPQENSMYDFARALDRVRFLSGAAK